eukprot:3496016-Ditylum_brightwellii.AAC.1
MLIIYVPLLAVRTVATINVLKKQLLQQEIYHHVLNFPKGPPNKRKGRGRGQEYGCNNGSRRDGGREVAWFP